MMDKKTVVIGASPSPERYSHRATVKLKQYGHTVIPVGIRSGEINGLEIQTGRPALSDVDTVTMYVAPTNQPVWYNYIFSLHPRRIIFNPGAENPELEKMAREKGIETLEACTLVMLSIGNY